MKIATWNVNGIRAAARSGFVDWLTSERADVVAVQEIKANPSQLDETLIHPPGYHSYWHPAKRPGYSGVALFTRKEPVSVQEGIGIESVDLEGRVLSADFGSVVVVAAYFPNSQRDHARLGFKLEFCKEMLAYCDQLRRQGRSVVLCGDFNIAHREIDLRFPQANTNNAGFLPEERAWMDQFLAAGYVDTFREVEKGPGHYTWWSYRPGIRARNIGWRLDYHVVDPSLCDRIEAVEHRTKVLGSDHCPVVLSLKE